MATQPTCGQVRRYLSDLAQGRTGQVDPTTWQTLLNRGAVTDASGAPAITTAGRHVLAELDVRASRTDDLSLDAVADQLSRVLVDLDGVAKTAEYFLAELGPVTPAEALPLLRPVAVELANRRGSPEELAEEFRGYWGSVEVMGGDPRDRLLAAALLQAAGATMEKVYSPMMTTVLNVRETAGARAPAVTIAALLHVSARPDGPIPYESYLSLRKLARTEEGAAMLAATGQGPTAILARRQALLDGLARGGAPTGDDQVAAGYLAVCGADPSTRLERVREARQLLGNRFPSPSVAAALVANADWVRPAELVNWLDKATEIARRRTLAPSTRELSALGMAMVLGLPPSALVGPGARPVPPLEHLANLVAVNAWVYGELVPVTAGGTLNRGPSS